MMQMFVIGGCDPGDAHSERIAGDLQQLLRGVHQVHLERGTTNQWK